MDGVFSLSGCPNGGSLPVNVVSRVVYDRAVGVVSDKCHNALTLMTLTSELRIAGDVDGSRWHYGFLEKGYVYSVRVQSSL